MKKLGVILQLFSFMLVLGHNMSGHEQCEKVEDIHCHEEHDDLSFLDFLADHFFHANTGIDHLETFAQNSHDIPLFSFVKSVNQTAVFDVTILRNIDGRSILDYTPPPLKSPHSRGPPVLI